MGELAASEEVEAAAGGGAGGAAPADAGAADRLLRGAVLIARHRHPLVSEADIREQLDDLAVQAGRREGGRQLAAGGGGFLVGAAARPAPLAEPALVSPPAHAHRQAAGCLLSGFHFHKRAWMASLCRCAVLRLVRLTPGPAPPAPLPRCRWRAACLPTPTP